MEDTLREGEDLWILHRKGVLILVLMEDTLRVKEEIKSTGKINCLNPCFNGRYSQRVVCYDIINYKICLNPCFNGRYSQRRGRVMKLYMVLSLNPCFNGRYSQSIRFIAVIPTLCVLILVLMEDTLRGNPHTGNLFFSFVLILVLMEDTLREQRLMFLCIRVFGVCSNF